VRWERGVPDTKSLLNQINKHQDVYPLEYRRSQLLPIKSRLVICKNEIAELSKYVEFEKTAKLLSQTISESNQQRGGDSIALQEIDNTLKGKLLTELHKIIGNTLKTSFRVSSCSKDHPNAELMNASFSFKRNSVT